ncbi:MAG: hypothetical protein EU547_00125 [Promethearchaeota archaeon]|nr:MAG: hypothetical protein EU547_00125 [Candidatus Lokiarchaeota archaeon]
MDNEKTIEKIISYLNSKGKIKAALLSKLTKHFCHNHFKNNFQISEEKLIRLIIKMLKRRVIEIIIPELFSIAWEKKGLRNLEYFKDGMYYIRKYQKDINQLLILNKKSYFDTRDLDFNNQNLIRNIIINLKKSIKENPKLKKKIIIYYPEGSLSLNIYGNNLKRYYNLNKWNKNTLKKNPELKKKLLYPLNKQRFDLSIMGKYRNSYMCFYITLIESLQKKIYDLQKDPKKRDDELIQKYTEKFAYYCQMYVSSDWIEISQSNPLRWETFFKHFDIPIKVLVFKFNSLKFYGNVFDAWIKLKIAIPIKKKYSNLIQFLKKEGLEPLFDSDIDIGMGFNINIFIPSPSIEYFYFISKYIFFYHLFLLFNKTFEYFKSNKEYNFMETDYNLYKTFSNILKELFFIDENNKKLIFRFYTYEESELELIYCKFLLKKIKTIEKKLFTYFLMRSSKKP